MSTQQGTPPFEGDQGSPIFGQLFLRFSEEFYLLFRLILAFVAALHGAQKAFGLWGFPVPHPERPIVTVAGWVELISAFLIGLGVFTRLGAGALVVTMVIAYFMMHSPGQPWPHLKGGGEVPLLWFAMSGIIGVLGSRKWGIERMIFKRELL